MAMFNGTPQNDTLLASQADDIIMAWEGDDLLLNLGDSATLDGGSGNDTASYANYIYYNFGWSVMRSEGINANLDSGIVQFPARSTSFFSAPFRPRNGRLINIENLIGSGYNDTLAGNDANNSLWGGGGQDRIAGGGGNDTLDGGDGNDTLAGGLGDDTVNGGRGDDTLIDDAGVDAFNGGDGIDTVDYSSATNLVYLNLQSNQAFLYDDWRYSTIANIENAIGGRGSDWFGGNAANNHFRGGTGNDTLAGGEGNDTLFGEADNDSLEGGTGADFLDGGDGIDTLNGGDGIDTAAYSSWAGGITADLAAETLTYAGHPGTERLISIENLIGSSGNDSIFGSQVSNWISSGAGDDVVVGLEGSDTLEGGAGNDSLFGGSQRYSDDGTPDGDDALFGGAGNDFLMGGAGNDTLEGGSGSDRLWGGTGFDIARITGDVDMTVTSYLDPYARNPRSDTVYQGAEVDSLSAVEQIHLIGGESNNTLSALGAEANVILDGMGGNDVLQGSRVDDTLYGGAGDDTLAGGMGTNQLYGGAGKDTFVMFNYNPGMQVVHDFKRTEDRIDVQGLQLKDLRVVHEGNDSVVYAKETYYGPGNRPTVYETPRMRIKDAIVDSRDFVNVAGGYSMQHLSLNEDARKNVGNLVREWGRDYARFVGKTFKDTAIQANGNDPLLGGLSFTQGGMRFSNLEIAPNPEFVATQRARVKTTAGGSVSFTYGYSTENSTETTISDSHSVGFSMGRTISTEIGLEGFGSVGAETSFTVSYDYTRTKATSTGKTEGRSLESTATLNALPNSVMIAEGGAYQKKGKADFSVDMSVEGNVRLTFTDNSFVDVPIGAILQTYLPTVFRGEGAVVEKTLDHGMQLAYNATTTFTQAGSIELSAYQVNDAQDYTVQDDSLLDTTQWTHRGEAHAENFWVVNGFSVPGRGVDALTGEPVVLQISDFRAHDGKFTDKVGIFLDADRNGISDVDFRQISLSTVMIEVQGTGFGNTPVTVTQESTRVSLVNGSLGTTTALVDLVGVKQNELSSENFIFSKEGTFFDSTIATYSGGRLTGQPV